jgi:hypothetical protein
MGTNTIVYHGATDVTTTIPYPEAGQASVSSLKTNLTEVDEATTIDTSMNTIIADTTSGAFTLTLPSAVNVKGIEYTFKKIGTGTNAVTIDAAGDETIDGSANYQMTVTSDFVTIKSDGENWIIIDKYNATSATITTLTCTTGNIATVAATTVNATTGNITAVESTYLRGYQLELNPANVTDAAVSAGVSSIILADATAAAITVTLPDVTTSEGIIYTIKKIDVSENAVTVTPHGDAGAEPIDGANTYVLDDQYDTVTIICDGAAWYVLYKIAAD